MNKLRSLDLFTGIGGLILALEEWCEPVAYCEKDPDCRAVLTARIKEGNLPNAPIFGDVRELRGDEFGAVDILVGGFPCQDISYANSSGRGLEGERSGLFFEIVRLSDVLRPSFLFFENVPAITTRGGLRVVQELAARGYAARWDMFSAAEVGARHLRKRWFLLAYADSTAMREQSRWSSARGCASPISPGISDSRRAAHTNSDVRHLQPPEKRSGNGNDLRDGSKRKHRGTSGSATTTRVARGIHAIPSRVDRYRMLGNAVVPAQGRLAFQTLMGI